MTCGIVGVRVSGYVEQMRYALIAAMAFAWLCISYPYGLWLFVLGAALVRPLQRADQFLRARRDPGIGEIVR